MQGLPQIDLSNMKQMMLPCLRMKATDEFERGITDLFNILQECLPNMKLELQMGLQIYQELVAMHGSSFAAKSLYKWFQEGDDRLGRLQDRDETLLTADLASFEYLNALQLQLGDLAQKVPKPSKRKLWSILERLHGSAKVLADVESEDPKLMQEMNTIMDSTMKNFQGPVNSLLTGLGPSSESNSSNNSAGLLSAGIAAMTGGGRPSSQKEFLDRLKKM